MYGMVVHGLVHNDEKISVLMIGDVHVIIIELKYGFGGIIPMAIEGLVVVEKLQHNML
ncbi:MAG: hypothetical protein PHU93_03825 [Candidatus Gracilibacteria bacterium]|nr:hypothetical protein [Candidatus Gracilibacteria bacterium]